VCGVEEGFYQSGDRRSSYELERKLNAAHVVVGVNAFLEGNDEPPPDTLRIGRRSKRSSGAGSESAA